MTNTTDEENNWENVFINESPFDKLHLVGRNWLVMDVPPRAVILFVHGSGEHCQRYRHVARFFNSHHIACVSFDMRGHGESQGERGFAPNLTALHDDLQYMIEYVQTELYPTLPLIIYAHGTGSLICLGYILRRPEQARRCQAMIISTPSLCLRRRPTSLILYVSRVFANLDPHFRLPAEGNFKNIYTNDPEIVEAYRNDRLVHDRWPATTVSIFLELGSLLEQRTIRTVCPLLVQHGADDNITPIKGIRKWVRKRVRGQIQFKEWSGNYHELHNDLNREEILTYALRWIEENLKI